MEWVTTTAKTLPEAIDLALDNLGVDESEAEIVVLEEPSKGLFGRVRGTARVEARVKPKAIRPKTERGRNRRGRNNERPRGERSGRRGRNNDRGARSGGSESGESNGSKRSRNKPAASKSDSKGESKANDRSNDTATGAAAASGEGTSSRRRSRGTGGGGGDGRGNGRGKNGAAKSRNDKKSADKTKADTKQEETPVEEVAEHLRSFLGGLTEAFGLEGDVDIDTTETDVMVATVQGQHGLMVGPKGRTLDAIQELARVSSQRAAPSSIRIRIDVGGYRKQRASALGEFARKAADKAVDNGAEVALEPMSPADRKSIHDALVEDNRVETRSVGTEPRRKVVVIPLVDANDDADSDGADDNEEE